MVWTTIPDGDIDPESPIDAPLMAALRDNPVAIAGGLAGAPKVQNAALNGLPWAQAQLGSNSVGTAQLINLNVTEAKLAASAVAQSKLKTTNGEISQSMPTSMTRYTLPGGAYGFYPRLRSATTSKNATVVISDLTTSGFLDTNNRCEVSCDTTGMSGVGATLYVNQQYVTASPPYDLGDGEVPFFIFALIAATGEVVGGYAAPDPPWAYNGPTDIAPHLHVNGQAMRRVMLPERFAGRDLAEQRAAAIQRAHQVLRIDPSDRLIETLIPVDADWKNADMGLIPHPFSAFPAQLTPVLLDTQSPVVARVAELHAAGESPCELLHNWLVVDNTPTNSRAPQGVLSMRCRWRNTRRS